MACSNSAWARPGSKTALSWLSASHDNRLRWLSFQIRRTIHQSEYRVTPQGPMIISTMRNQKSCEFIIHLLYPTEYAIVIKNTFGIGMCRWIAKVTSGLHDLLPVTEKSCKTKFRISWAGNKNPEVNFTNIAETRIYSCKGNWILPAGMLA